MPERPLDAWVLRYGMDDTIDSAPFRRPGRLPREARGFASPPRDGFAFVVGVNFAPVNGAFKGVYALHLRGKYTPPRDVVGRGALPREFRTSPIALSSDGVEAKYYEVRLGRRS